MVKVAMSGKAANGRCPVAPRTLPPWQGLSVRSGRRVRPAAPQGRRVVEEDDRVLSDERQDESG